VITAEPGGHGAEGSQRSEQLGAGGAVNCAVHSSSADEGTVGRRHQDLGIHRGDVAVHDLDPHAEDSAEPLGCLPALWHSWQTRAHAALKSLGICARYSQGVTTRLHQSQLQGQSSSSRELPFNGRPAREQDGRTPGDQPTGTPDVPVGAAR